MLENNKNNEYIEAGRIQPHQVDCVLVIHINVQACGRRTVAINQLSFKQTTAQTGYFTNIAIKSKHKVKESTVASCQSPSHTSFP